MKLYPLYSDRGKLLGYVTANGEAKKTSRRRKVIGAAEAEAFGVGIAPPTRKRGRPRKAETVKS